MEQQNLQAALEEAVEQEFALVSRRFGLSAFKRGWEDAQSNKPCPYFDHRTVKGQVTFARAYRRMWAKGVEAYRTFNEGKMNNL